MPVNKNLYDLLGIPSDASPEEIKRAYREQSRKAHPDLNPRAGANTEFLNIQEAYDTLIDSTKRLEYDRQLRKETNQPLSLDILYSRSKIPRLNEPQLIYAYLKFSPHAEFVSAANPHLNLCLVLDRSTSMQGQRLDQVKLAAVELVRQTEMNDLLTIVTFSDRAEVVLQAERQRDRQQSENLIHLIKASGGTELYQGLLAGYQQVQTNLHRSMINHIFVITDGHTYGDEEACIELADRCAAQGISITALGIGTEWNDEFLDKLVDQAGGSSHYISNSRDLPKFVEGEFSKLKRVFAERLLLRLAPSNGVRIGAAFRLQPDSTRLAIREEIPLGNIQLKDHLVLLLEMVVDLKSDKASRYELANGSLDLVLPSNPTLIHRIPLRLSRPIGEPPEDESPPPEIIHALTRITLYRMQQRARLEVAAGKVQEATSRLRRMATQLLSMGETELAKISLQEVDRIINSQGLSAEGEKKLKYATRALLLPASHNEPDI